MATSSFFHSVNLNAKQAEWLANFFEENKKNEKNISGNSANPADDLQCVIRKLIESYDAKRRAGRRDINSDFNAKCTD